MTPTPFDKLLVELQLLNRPEDKEKLEWLEGYVAWKAAGGPAKMEAAKAAKLTRQYREHYELRVKQTKKKGQP